MASVAAENWEYMENLQQDDFEGLEFSHVNQGLLMSLLDESQVDADCDDERLTKVIQSLEAEIDPDGHHSADWSDESGGQDWSAPHDVDHHNWMDVDQFAPSGDMEKYWSIDDGEEGIAGNCVLDQWTDDETHFVSSVVNDHTSSFIN